MRSNCDTIFPFILDIKLSICTAFVLLTLIVHWFNNLKSWASLNFFMSDLSWCIFDAFELSRIPSNLAIKTKFDIHWGATDSSMMSFISSFSHAFFANSSFSVLMNLLVWYGGIDSISILCFIKLVFPMSKLFFENISSYFLHSSCNGLLYFFGM